LAYQFLTRSVGCYDFPSTVLAARNGQQQNGLRAGFQDDGTNYLETFASISDDLSDSGAFGEIIAGVRKLTPSIKSIELETQKRSEIWVGHQVGENPVMTLSLSQQSEGMRRFLAQMLALYQVPRKQTLIFEEPEKGIYPGALQVLADYFKSEAEQRSQIILTTHNPLLLDQLPIDSLRVVELDSHATRIGRLSKEQLQVVKEHLLSPGELLTVDEARSNFERPLAG
jgi:predicted ATPase